MPILSVIIPIYNTEKFLGQCLESVIKQSYKNLDILLIDDGSTDNSSKICEKYQKKDNRIRFLKLNHQGKSNACDEVLAAGVDTIRISLQGLDAETYERVCGVKMEFDSFVSNLRYLYEHKGMCKIRMKIADLAIKDLEDKEKRLEEIFGDISDSLFIESIIPIYSSVDYESVDTTIAQKALHGRENIKQSKIHKVCHRPFYRMLIRANGDVTAACCDSVYDIVYGNIMQQRLVDIWKGEKRKNFLRMQLEGKRFQHPICKSCVLPNDITNEADIMDPWAGEILKRFV